VPNGAPRIPGFDYRGVRRYSLTICTYGRSHVFIDKDIVQSVLDDIERVADVEHFRVLAYCFMPDHLHLLVQGELDSADLQRFVTGWKQTTGFKYAKERGGPLWQVGFFDHVLRCDEDTNRHAEYILSNPIRAGLTHTIGEYPFAGCTETWPEPDGQQAPEA
jgi:putative transposase